MPDFGLLQTPNFAASAQAGYQAGQAIGKQRRLDTALGGYDPNKPETALAVLREDPGMGMGLLNASTALATQHREAAGREATGKYLIDHFGLKGGDPASGVTQGGQVSPGAPSGTDANGDIVVTANAPVAPHNDQLEIDAINADPEAYMKTKLDIGKMDLDHRQAIGDAAEAQGTVAMAAQKVPYADRAAFIQEQMPYLSQHGVTQQQIASFDPTDQNIMAMISQAQGVKGMLAQHNTEVDDARQDRNVNSQIGSRNLRDGFAANSDARSAAARGEAHTRFAERGVTKAGAAKPAATPAGQRAVVGGKTYVKIGGKWTMQ